jgi:hypothetical protein
MTQTARRPGSGRDSPPLLLPPTRSPAVRRTNLWQTTSVWCASTSVFSVAPALRWEPESLSHLSTTNSAGGYNVCLGWPIAPSYTSPNAGECWVLANEYSCAHRVTWSPNKLWRSNSSNLWYSGCDLGTVRFQVPTDRADLDSVPILIFWVSLNQGSGSWRPKNVRILRIRILTLVWTDLGLSVGLWSGYESLNMMSPLVIVPSYGILLWTSLKYCTRFTVLDGIDVYQGHNLNWFPIEHDRRVIICNLTSLCPAFSTLHVASSYT